MRRKTKKMRGKRTHGYGSRKKHRGKGSKGGKGMSGSGKRADQKKTFVLKRYGKDYFGKKGFVPTKKRKRKRSINLDQLEEFLNYFLNKGFAKKVEGGYEIDLEKAGYSKLLGRGRTDEKFLIKVRNVSEKAKQEVEKSGGKIIIVG